VLAETAIDFLDDRFAPVAAGQIEIDVRPGIAAFGEETLEEEIVADGVTR